MANLKLIVLVWLGTVKPAVNITHFDQTWYDMISVDAEPGMWPALKTMASEYVGITVKKMAFIPNSLCPAKMVMDFLHELLSCYPMQLQDGTAGFSAQTALVGFILMVFPRGYSNRPGLLILYFACFFCGLKTCLNEYIYSKIYSCIYALP